MRALKIVIGVMLVALGLFALLQQRSPHGTVVLTILEPTCLILGIFLLNRALTHKPLIPDNDKTRRMLVIARQRWLIGSSAVCLFFLSLLVEALGTQIAFGYDQTWPELSTATVTGLAAAGAFQLWRYLEFVRSGSQSHG